MSNNPRYAIPRDVLAAGPAVFPHMVDGVRVYVKKLRRRKNPAGHLALRFLYAITGHPFLVPPGGSPGNVAAETTSLLRLEKLGVRAPRVLHVEESYFVMTSVGERRLDRYIREHAGEREKYIAMAAEELRRLHDLGLAHGGAQIRNFTVSEERINFLDFEEVIPAGRVAAFQARDIFLFLLSLERDGFDPDLRAVCAAYDGDDTGTSFSSISGLLARLRVVRLVESPIFSSMRLKDVRSLAALVRKAGT